MKAFGDYLRRERELRGITLDELAQTTKISPITLATLEKGELEALPPIPFVKGFLRAYADSVGLDSSSVVLRFEAEFLAEEAEARRARQVPWQRIRHLASMALGGAAAAAVITLLMVYRDDIRRWLRPRPPPRPVVEKPTTPDPVQEEVMNRVLKNLQLKGVDDPFLKPPVEVPTDPPPSVNQVPNSLTPNYLVPRGGLGDAGAGDAAPPRDPRHGTVPPSMPETRAKPADTAAETASGLMLHADDGSWVEVAADGGKPVERQLERGDDWNVAGARFVVRVGNGGAVRLTLNGRDLGAAGPPGQIARVELSGTASTVRSR